MVRTAEQIARSKALEIRVHPNGRWLVSGGKVRDEPFFWQADTAWEIFHRLDETEAKHYLDTRAAQGFNVVFGVIFAEHGGLTLPNRDGEWPFEPKKGSSDAMYEPDVLRPNPKYYDFVDKVVDYAASVGIRMALQPVWGNYVNGMYHRIAMPFDNEEAAFSYAKFCAGRYPYLPWLNGGDTVRFWHPDAYSNAREGKAITSPQMEARDYGPVFEAFAQGIVAGEHKHRGDSSAPFIAFHPAAVWLPGTPPAYASAWFGDRQWLTIDGIQSGHAVGFTYPTPVDSSHGQFGAFTAQNSVDYVRHMYDASTKDGSLRPVIDLEPHYESTHYSFRPAEPMWKRSNIRQGAWQAAFAGAAGLTYGVNSVWQMNNLQSRSHPPIPHNTVSASNWFDELDLPGGQDVSRVTKWVLSRPSFFARVPDQSIITSDTFDRADWNEDADGKDAKLIAGTRDSDGKWLAVYSPEGAPFTVDLTKLAAGEPRAVWFDPRTGEERPAEAAAGKAASVKPPTKGKEQDWVYYVEA